VQKGRALSSGNARSRLAGGQRSKDLPSRRESRSTDVSASRSPAAHGANEAGQSSSLGGTPSPGPALVAHFARLAEVLDAAGLGPADYLYLPLKWQLQRLEVSQYPLRRPLLRAIWHALSNPPLVPRELRRAAILAASSYIISANLLRQVVADLEPGEGALCDAGNVTSRLRLARLIDALRVLWALPSALVFALRVHSTLIKGGAGSVECNRIALAAFVHGIHRRAARAVLRRVRPKCLVIGNGNRPLEFSLWAEARALGIATVLLPYAEINLKPPRFLSLCRGDFDLVLPLSEYSAAQMRKLKHDVQLVVVGFPVGFESVDIDEGAVEKSGSRGRDVLYIAGNNFEAAAAEIMRGAFENSTDLRLRVRPHPRSRGLARNKRSEASELFGWLDPDCMSDPEHTELAEDIASSDVVIAIRSTAAIDAMIAGVPLVWLSPLPYREELERAPLRMQKLGSLEATTSIELRKIVTRLLDDERERKRVVEEQWSRLRAAGYDRDYFNTVRSALRQLVGVDAKPVCEH